jgi:hypothetical protein
MPNRPNYPASVSEILDPSMKFKPGVIPAVKRFKRNKPYRGSLDERKLKFSTLHQDLCALFSKQTTLTFGTLDGSDSGSSSYCPSTDTIVLRGKLSVVTYLHEFAHALGRDERGACKWSVNLFKRTFPVLFSRCQHDGHTLRRPDAPRTNEGA